MGLVVAVIPAVCLFVVLLCICFVPCDNDDDVNVEFAAVRGTIRQQRQQQAQPVAPSSGDIETSVAPSIGPSPTCSSSKTEQLLCKFKFHTVTANQSNFSAASIRATEDMENTSSAAGNDGDDDDASVIQTEQKNSKWSLRQILFSWRKLSKNDSCCICLEAYRPGETICAAATPACDHVFHQECIFQWLQSEHDECPLCRVDLMNR